MDVIVNICKGRNDLDVDIENKLGNGAFGTLFIGFLRDQKLRGEGKVKVAVREIDFHRRADLCEFRENVRTMTELNHPNLLKVFGTCEVDGQECLVTAYMKNGSLGRNKEGEAK
ncbi:uncharacterized protein LOC132745626, partial [Ruditapes philippinarum]|uniref:uncharacterized protein LOC132745626 n=1 Tax=Ruditapes philippinarum TaxID=129788 RepID=UPI00295BE16B